MSTYELMIVLSPELDEESQKKLREKIKSEIAKAKGEMISEDFWGKRKLAYEIKHQSEGIYDVFTLKLAPDKLSMLDKKLKLEEKVMRFLITKK